MKILNLGCGTKASPSPEVINIDWSIELRLRSNPVSKYLITELVSGNRLNRFNSLPDNILVHNLSKGIPFADNSVDVVYHSHFLEHLDRDVAECFLLEVKRVLKPGGIQRIVVPDLRKVCISYLAHTEACEEDHSLVHQHDAYVGDILEQCVRREAYGSSQQNRFWRTIENVILGDARKRGETHQWMYDEFNLCGLLRRLGYASPVVQSHARSMISKWPEYALDTDDAGEEYKPGSLYMEATK